MDVIPIELAVEFTVGSKGKERFQERFSGLVWATGVFIEMRKTTRSC